MRALRASAFRQWFSVIPERDPAGNPCSGCGRIREQGELIIKVHADIAVRDEEKASSGGKWPIIGQFQPPWLCAQCALEAATEMFEQWLRTEYLEWGLLLSTKDNPA